MKHECVACNGTGCDILMDFHGDIYTDKKCKECDGTGELEACQCHAYCACECICGAWNDRQCDCWEA